MDQSTRRALVRRWVRGAIAIGLFLVLPTLFTHLLGALDPHRERAELARAAEREQRANGVPFVTSSGDTVRAVVYSPAHPGQAAEDAQHRGLVWWSRLLAAVTALGLLTGTWRTLRR
jgi:hypothetical protein